MIILGTKIGMDRIFLEDGTVVPVTAVLCATARSVGTRTVEKDGYNAAIIGFGKEGSKTKLAQNIVEFRDLEANGEKLIESFNDGDKIKISSISKGQGFAGVMKRHNFKGGRASHGAKNHRRGGSNAGPRRAGNGFVQKGKRMPGRMGSDRITRKNQIIQVWKDKEIILIKGAIAGGRGTLIQIKKI